MRKYIRVYIIFMQNYYAEFWHNQATMKVLGSLVVATSFFLLVASLCVGPANSLFCWSNSDSSADAEWEIQECVMTNSDTSCLSQYRLHNGELVPSYFGCHTTDIPCSFNCTATDCGKNAFTCCCSSDLCNEIERVTPSLKEVTRESGATEQTPATLPQTETPPVEGMSHRQHFTIACFVYIMATRKREYNISFFHEYRVAVIYIM